jgi:hypothetical protein
MTLGVVLGHSALAAPLFPDVKDDHWAKDAVAALAAKGLLEGYPDGTFKGDRAASRWEVAMIVARLLAKMEQSQATFATKADLDDLRKLVDSLKDELGALGVRVTNLDEQVGRLDKRVTELERITFYGYVDTRVSGISIRNTGAAAQRSLNPAVQVNTIDYNAAVGSVVGAGGALPGVAGIVVPPAFSPFSDGPLTTTNWQTGQPLVNGVGFTSKAVLGVKVKVTDDIDAGAEFAAYTSQGNNVVDAYYGVNANYLSNPFTQTAVVNGAGGDQQGLNNSPYTRMTLDHFWIRHAPTDTTLTIGAFSGTNFDRDVYGGMINPNMTGPTYLDNFGVDVRGTVKVGNGEGLKIQWEAMGSKLPDGDTGALPGTTGYGTSYQSHVEGANINFLFNDEHGNVKLNFLHATDDASGGTAQTVGLLQAPNVVLNWVNPNGYYYSQLGAAATAGIGSTSDKRPIPTIAALGVDGSVAAQARLGLLPTGAPNVGGIGPQNQITYGASASYKFDNAYEPKIYGSYAHSDYESNKNSGYTVGADAYRGGASILLLDKAIDLDASYLSVAARFSPFVIAIPEIGGITSPLWRTPDFNYNQNEFSLHDTTEFPNNRQGVRAKMTWKFLPTGRFIVEYGRLNQTQTSLQDVRFSAGALGGTTPNTPVLGFSPGFVDPVFTGFSPYTFASANGNGLAVPLENPRGYEENIYVSAGHKWLFDEATSNRGLTLSAGFKGVKFERDSNLSSLVAGGKGIQGEDVNYVNLAFQGFHFGLDYDITDNFTAKLGFTQIDIFGHLDPLGGSASYAESLGFAKFTNVDMTELFPQIGFEYRLSDDVTWGSDFRYYFDTDHVPSGQYVNSGLEALNFYSGPQSAHPFNWQGIQWNTSFKVKF